MNQEIKKALSDIEYPEVKEALQIFASEGRPFALPSFRLQEQSSAKQRTADLLGGFPYTTDAYPWPVAGPDDLHMQPVIQVNLEEAGKLLNFDFGKGLLQVWSVVGKDAKSFNTVEMALDVDKSKGAILRVIPVEEISKPPIDFFPDFAPWQKSGLPKNEGGLLFIEPDQHMAEGSLVKWKLAKQWMYPTPFYELHNIEALVPNPTEVTEGVDGFGLFEELKAGVSALLKTPADGGSCYLGGVRGYGDGRDADPAQGFPVLLNIGGEVNLSVIFDESISIKEDHEILSSGSKSNFSREKKLRAVYFYTE
jgi:hypothetical protein